LKQIIFLLFYVNLFAFNSYQIQTLQLVMDNAKLYKDYQGETYPKTMAAICLAESSAGKKESIGKKTIGDIDTKTHKIENASLGIMQLRVETIKDIAKKYKIKNLLNKSDREIAKLVLNNRVLSARLATLYFIMNINNYKQYSIAISRYNGGTKNYKYIKRVLDKIKLVNKLIANGKLRI